MRYPDGASATGYESWGDLTRLGPVDGAGAVSAVRTLLVAAHPDDDLYFFNPHLAAVLRGGAAHLTVTLLTGEADGKNANPGDPDFAAVEVDFEGYAAARAAGLRRAYASMVLGTPDAVWHREEVTVGRGRCAELATLVDAPRVRLLMLDIRDHGSHQPGFAGTLHDLWQGRSDGLPTVGPAGSPLRSACVYTREDVIATVAAVVGAFRPTLVWTLDPDPDAQRHNPATPRFSDSPGMSDHDSHTAAALFAHAALARWWTAGALGDVVVEAFRGYYVRRWPSNLSPAARATKQRYISVYGWADDRPARDGIGWGDRKVHRRRIGAGNASGTTPRYPGAGNWLQRGCDGRLVAFAVTGGAARMWVQRRPRVAGFHPPLRLGGCALLPHLWPVALPDGGFALFAVRIEVTADPEAQVREVVVARVHPDDGAPPQWSPLGNPSAAHPVKRRSLGMPVACGHPDGGLRVFVRNHGKGLSSRRYTPDGGWGTWLDLHGGHTQDGLAVAAVGAHGYQVFAAHRDGIARWTGTGDTAAYQILDVDPPAAPPSLLALGDGRLLLAARRADRGDVAGYLLTADAATMVRLGDCGGGSPISMTCADDPAVLLAGRNDDARTAIARTDLAGRTPAWTVTGPPIARIPSVALDAAGTPAVAALGLDGRLHLARPGHRDGDWTWTTIG